MRCIETRLSCHYEIFYNDKLQHEMYWNLFSFCFNPLAVWDKLQHEMYWNLSSTLLIPPNSLINYNMRCIETTQGKHHNSQTTG